MTAYYNEIEPYAAQWLRNLIAAGHIADGVVDTRSIEDVSPAELSGFTQCHFFAGIGGWSLALRLAGWPDDRPAWTGSCPCQPFSAAGKGDGFTDERHLWPAWQHLIAQCSPPVIFGEQVASKAAEAWIDLVHADMEGMGYAFGCVPFPAAGIGAPHIRDRNYWMANADGPRSQAGLPTPARGYEGQPGVADDCGGEHAGTSNRSPISGMGDPQSDGRQWRGRLNEQAGGASAAHDGAAGPTNGVWGSAEWLHCRDDKRRPVEPGTFPLAHGIPGRVGRLRAYGNAIVPQQAAHFIEAFVEAAGVKNEVMEKVS